jgi:hypothetical protein
MSKQVLHQWSNADAQRVKTCQRPGCGIQCIPSFGMLRAFGYRRGPEDAWQVGIIPCMGDDVTKESTT